jgi:quercetin dioxygenase-like cupin family protein
MRQRIVLIVLIRLSVVVGRAWAEDNVFNFNDEVKKGEQRAGFTNQVLVKTSSYTVGAVAVKDEIKPHRHNDGEHVLYIVSGGGTMTHGDKTITLGSIR